MLTTPMTLLIPARTRLIETHETPRCLRGTRLAALGLIVHFS
jgi:hypothetical protein